MERKLIDHFENVYICEDSKGSEVAKRFMQIFPKKKIHFIQSGPSHSGNLSTTEFNRSKKNLLIKKFQGSFFKRCPGFSQKKALTCCNYHVLNLGQQCNFNCSYCYLQSYLNYPFTLIYSNIEDALAELSEMAKLHSHSPFRIGTGEVIDSLSLDPLTLYSVKLIHFFTDYPKWTLELKTKSANIHQFAETAHAGNILVSWSINPQNIIAAEEHGTANLQERLLAARRCAEKKFKIAFHIDPMIYHPNWKDNYAHLAEQITKQFSPQEVDLISLGTLRFQPGQRHMMRERFGLNSYVTRAEMHPSENGKLRYDAGLRREMSEHMIKKFKQHSSDWNIIMCMETPENWISAFDATPMQIPSTKQLFQGLPKV